MTPLRHLQLLPPACLYTRPLGGCTNLLTSVGPMVGWGRSSFLRDASDWPEQLRPSWERELTVEVTSSIVVVPTIRRMRWGGAPLQHRQPTFGFVVAVSSTWYLWYLVQYARRRCAMRIASQQERVCPCHHRLATRGSSLCQIYRAVLPLSLYPCTYDG